MAQGILARGSPVPLLVLLGLLWGATFPISRLGIEGGASPFLLVALAFAVAIATSGPIAALRRVPFPSPRAAVESAAVGALLIGGINLPLFWGERFATGGVASVVYATAPMLSLGFARLSGTGERVGRGSLAALGLGLGGVVVLAMASGGAAVTSAWGLLAFGLGATCQGAGAVVLGRIRPRGESAWGETFQFAGGGLASLAVVALATPHGALPWTPAVLASAVYVGAVSMAVGYAIFFGLVHRHGAVGANQVTYLNPVIAVALGVLVFGEPFAPEEAGGLALILIALALLHFRTRPAPGGGTPALGPSSPVGRTTGGP